MRTRLEGGELGENNSWLRGRGLGGLEGRRVSWCCERAENKQGSSSVKVMLLNFSAGGDYSVAVVMIGFRNSESIPGRRR